MTRWLLPTATKKRKKKEKNNLRQKLKKKKTMYRRYVFRYITFLVSLTLAKIKEQHIHASTINVFSGFSIWIMSWCRKEACFHAKQDGIQLWGTASNSNLEILERFQSKVLRITTDAPWYIPNAIIKRDLQIPTVKQEVRKYSANYRKRLDAHPNNLANALFQEQLGTRRLQRLYPADLVTNG